MDIPKANNKSDIFKKCLVYAVLIGIFLASFYTNQIGQIEDVSGGNFSNYSLSIHE